MYFITIDANNYITGIYDGSLDYVHRITGEPIEGAFQLPAGAFAIDDMCWEAIKSATPDSTPKWDSVNSCIIQEIDLTVAGKRKKLYAERIDNVLEAEEARIAGLTEAEIDAELGA